MERHKHIPLDQQTAEECAQKLAELEAQLAEYLEVKKRYTRI